MLVTDLFEPSRLEPQEQPLFANVLVTPEAAEKALRLNVNFRNLQPSRVKRYATDMTKGAWVERTGESIGFDVDGRLVDGQHRLEAIRASGVPMELTVAYNLSPEAVGRDQGMTRTATQAMEFERVPEAGIVVPIVRWVLVYRQYVETGKLDPRSRASTADIRRAIAEHPNVLRSAAIVRATRLDGIAPRSMVGFVHYFGARTSPSRADTFVESLGSPEREDGDSPVLLLRTRLVRLATRHRIDETVSRIHLCALIAKAWLHFEAGARIGVLKWDQRTSFPRFLCDDQPAQQQLAAG